MELIWKEIDAERLTAELTAQIAIRGELPSPDGRVPQGEPCCAASVVIDAAEAAHGEVHVVGRIPVLVTCFDADGQAFAYESAASFEKTVDAPGAAPGMTARASAVIETMQAYASGNGVRLEANAEIDVRVYSSVPMKVLGGVSGMDDLELKTERAATGRPVRVGGATVRMREELAADGVSEIVSCTGVISVREAVADQEGTAVGGVITVTAVCRGSDGRTGTLCRQAPFRERLSLDRPAAAPYCSAELKSLYLRSPGEGLGILVMEAEAEFTLWDAQSFEAELPTDAFSPTVGFDALTERTVLTQAMGRVSRQVSLREELALPPEASDPERVLCVNARPIVTDSVLDGGKLTVRGVVATQVVYQSTAGRVAAFTRDVPFETETEAPASDAAFVRAECAAYAEGFAERSLAVTYTLVLDAEFEARHPLPVLTGLAEHEKTESAGGVLLCFASEGETAFDVAKRYSVPCAAVRRLNPEASEPYGEGERLILIV